MIESWIDEMGLVAICILAGFLITILVTKRLNRRSGGFALVMILSIIYQTFMFTWLLGLYIYGLSIRYGHEFGQMIIVKDEKGDEKSIFNDGTYLIENGVIKSRQSFNEAKLYEAEDYNARLEPKFIYFLRVFFLAIGLLLILACTAFMILIGYFFCLTVTSQMSGGTFSASRARRNT